MKYILNKEGKLYIPGIAYAGKKVLFTNANKEYITLTVNDNSETGFDVESDTMVPQKTIITFYINDKYFGTTIECHAEENMNWLDWKNSKYYIDNILDITNDSYCKVKGTNTHGYSEVGFTSRQVANADVYPNDSIINNETYNLTYKSNNPDIF